jgi:hypothetical protein
VGGGSAEFAGTVNSQHPVFLQQSNPAAAVGGADGDDAYRYSSRGGGLVGGGNSTTSHPQSLQYRRTSLGAASADLHDSHQQQQQQQSATDAGMLVPMPEASAHEQDTADAAARHGMPARHLSIVETARQLLLPAYYERLISKRDLIRICGEVLDGIVNLERTAAATSATSMLLRAAGLSATPPPNSESDAQQPPTPGGGGGGSGGHKSQQQAAELRRVAGILQSQQAAEAERDGNPMLSQDDIANVQQLVAAQMRYFHRAAAAAAAGVNASPAAKRSPPSAGREGGSYAVVSNALEEDGWDQERSLDVPVPGDTDAATPGARARRRQHLSMFRSVVYEARGPLPRVNAAATAADAGDYPPDAFDAYGRQFGVGQGHLPRHGADDTADQEELALLERQNPQSLASSATQAANDGTDGGIGATEIIGGGADTSTVVVSRVQQLRMQREQQLQRELDARKAARNQAADALLSVSLQKPLTRFIDEDLVVHGHVGSCLAHSISLRWWLAYGPLRLVVNLDKVRKVGAVATFEVSQSDFVLVFSAGTLIPGATYTLHLQARNDRLGGLTRDAQLVFTMPTRVSTDAAGPDAGVRDLIATRLARLPRFRTGYDGDAERGNLSLPPDPEREAQLALEVQAIRDDIDGRRRAIEEHRATAAAVLLKAQQQREEVVRVTTAARTAAMRARAGLDPTAEAAADPSLVEGTVMADPSHNPTSFQDQLRDFFMRELEAIFSVCNTPVLSNEEFQTILRTTAKQFWNARPATGGYLDTALKREIISVVKREIEQKVEVKRQLEANAQRALREKNAQKREREQRWATMRGTGNGGFGDSSGSAAASTTPGGGNRRRGH